MCDLLVIRILYALRSKRWGLRRVQIVSTNGSVTVTVTLPWYTWLVLWPLVVRWRLWSLARQCALELRLDTVYLHTKTKTAYRLQ